MPRGKHLTKKEINTMIEMHQQGFTGVKIAKTLGRSNQSVSKVLSKFKAGKIRHQNNPYKTINAKKEDWAYVAQVAENQGIQIKDALTAIINDHRQALMIIEEARVEQLEYSKQKQANMIRQHEMAQAKKKSWWKLW